MNLESMYQEIILDHYRSPHHRGLREPYDVEVHHVNPMCGDEVTLFNEVLPELCRLNARILGISVDNIWSHKAFSKARNLRFLLLSDFKPKGKVARQYGVFSEEDDTAKRALFVIDGKGIVRWSYVSPNDVNPGVNGVLAELESLAAEERR